MVTDKKTLYIVTQNTEEFYQLRMLIDFNDDTEENIVGVKDGSVRLFNLGETMWEKNCIGENDKILFVGKVKKTSKYRKKAKYTDDDFGIRYGFYENKYAFLEVDPQALSDRKEYKKFIKALLELPLIEGTVSSKKSDSKKKDGVDFRKKEKKIVKHTTQNKVIKRVLLGPIVSPQPRVPFIL